MIISNKTEEVNRGGRSEGRGNCLPAAGAGLKLMMLGMFGVSLFTQFSAHWGRVECVCHGYWCLLAPILRSPAASFYSPLLARNLLAVPSKRRRTVYQDRDWNRSDVSHQLAASRRLQLDKCESSPHLGLPTNSLGTSRERTVAPASLLLIIIQLIIA